MSKGRRKGQRRKTTCHVKVVPQDELFVVNVVLVPTEMAVGQFRQFITAFLLHPNLNVLGVFVLEELPLELGASQSLVCIGPPKFLRRDSDHGGEDCLDPYLGLRWRLDLTSRLELGGSR